MAFVSSGLLTRASVGTKTSSFTGPVGRQNNVAQKPVTAVTMRMRGPAFNPLAASFAAPLFFEMMQPFMQPMMPSGKNVQMQFNPRGEAIEKDKEYIIRFELPGFTKDDVKTEIKGDVLVVKGNRHEEESKEESKEEQGDGENTGEAKSEQGNDEIKRRQSFGWSMQSSFIRSFTIPKDVDRQSIKAEMKDGILTINLQKQSKPEMETIDIPIN
mmetsp:Transcript_7880/g.23787  ORF Transcript_7880/g.23787 Transcript_7880/m.23787 type:complete len:214 (+) Transcript_7880:56-697(+)